MSEIKSEVDKLLSDLDLIARDYDKWEYGLPIDFETNEPDDPMTLMRLAVLNFTESLVNK